MAWSNNQLLHHNFVGWQFGLSMSLHYSGCLARAGWLSTASLIAGRVGRLLAKAPQLSSMWPLQQAIHLLENRLVTYSHGGLRVPKTSRGKALKPKHFSDIWLCPIGQTSYMAKHRLKALRDRFHLLIWEPQPHFKGKAYRHRNDLWLFFEIYYREILLKITHA